MRRVKFRPGTQLRGAPFGIIHVILCAPSLQWQRYSNQRPCGCVSLPLTHPWSIAMASSSVPIVVVGPASVGKKTLVNG
jgi:hypothetical protein